jgi:hypothetical protein
VRRLVLIATALTLVSAIPAAASVKNPCKLVTVADAKHALSVATVSPTTAQKVGLYESCTYITKVGTLVVQARLLNRSDFDKSAKANPGPVAHVSGIGSDAYTVKGGFGLLVWKNGTSVTLLVIGPKNAAVAEKALGKVVAGRL